MNVANLQIEGVLMALAAINNALVHKGILSVDEIDVALRRAEASVTSEERVFEEMSPSNRDAICFPLRLLVIANQTAGEDHVQPFSALAQAVGRSKIRYNDQR